MWQAVAQSPGINYRETQFTFPSAEAARSADKAVASVMLLQLPNRLSAQEHMNQKSP